MTQEKRSFLFLDEAGQRAAQRAQELAKLVLDTLRNFLVVAILFYAADRSGKWYVWAVAITGFLALYTYIMAYVDQLTFYYGFTKSLLLRLLLMIVSLGIVAVVSLGSILALMVAVNEIAAVQGSR